MLIHLSWSQLSQPGQREVRLRRVYDEPSSEDGRRILVDRLWPRGLSKQAARIDEWLKAVAPSAELRRWYGHDPAKFGEFRRRYLAELAEPERAAAWARLRDTAGRETITLLTAARAVKLSQAAVLAERLTPMTHATNGQADDVADDDTPGDPACLLRRVCPRCGSVADADPPTTCPQCHADMPGD